MSVTECLEELSAAKQKKDKIISIDLANELAEFIVIKARDEARLQGNIKQFHIELNKAYAALTKLSEDPGFMSISEPPRREARALLARWESRIW